jgi:hypothetical protein
MLVVMGNEKLVNKLLALAGGVIDLVQAAVRTAANGRKIADLGKAVDAVMQQRRLVVAPPIQDYKDQSCLS